MKEFKTLSAWLLLLAPIIILGIFFDAGLTSEIDPVSTSATPIMFGGFLGGLWKGIKKVGGSVIKIATKVAPIIPGVGVVVAGAAAAVGALSSGGQVQTVTPAAQPGGVPTVQTVGTYVPQAQVMQAGFGGDLMNFKLMGIPIIPIAFGAILIGFLIQRRR